MTGRPLFSFARNHSTGLNNKKPGAGCSRLRPRVGVKYECIVSDIEVNVNADVHKYDINAFPNPNQDVVDTELNLNIDFTCLLIVAKSQVSLRETNRSHSPPRFCIYEDCVEP
jgi:hypothetical protein